MKIRQIEIAFAVPVELTSSDQRILCEFVQQIAKLNTPEGMVHWQFGMGSKPRFSQKDATFLGKEIDPNAPLDGEPTFDSEIFFIETACREDYH